MKQKTKDRLYWVSIAAVITVFITIALTSLLPDFYHKSILKEVPELSVLVLKQHYVPEGNLNLPKEIRAYSIFDPSKDICYLLYPINPSKDIEQGTWLSAVVPLNGQTLEELYACPYKYNFFLYNYGKLPEEDILIRFNNLIKVPGGPKNIYEERIDKLNYDQKTSFTVDACEEIENLEVLAKNKKVISDVTFMDVILTNCNEEEKNELFSWIATEKGTK